MERTRSDPFAELFDALATRMTGDRWQPAVDVFETDQAIVLRVELAGVSAADLHVSVDGELVRISGVRRAPAGYTVKRLHQVEIAFGPFERTLRINLPFQRDAVEARLEEGFLCVTLPKLGRRQIEIER
jgi:HSP20 family protein